MSTQKTEALRRRHTYFPVCALLLAVTFAPTAWAQIGGIDPDPGDRGTGGRNTIEGRVYFPTGRTVDHHLKVTLTSVSIGGEFFTFTDDSGAFTFRRLASGTYTVTVDAGKEYLLARETVPIFDVPRKGPLGDTYPVHIQLQLKVGRANKPAVVDATLASVPKPARDEYEKAIQAEKAGDNKGSIEHLQTAVKLFPDFMVAFNEMGVQYLILGQLNDAAEALSQAVKIDPNSFTARLNYGIVLFYQKQYREANSQLASALEVNEASGRAHFFRGRTFIKLNDLAKAEKDFLRAVALGGSPEINEAHRYLGGIYRRQENYARAVAELETYLKLVPDTKDADQIRQIIRELRTRMTATRD